MSSLDLATSITNSLPSTNPLSPRYIMESIRSKRFKPDVATFHEKLAYFQLLCPHLALDMATLHRSQKLTRSNSFNAAESSFYSKRYAHFL
eukprot:TRINITY_DN6907_c0_g1_i1.p1 TRINITY_DN6907_c0_g1~~TRINITY_DN6907_c0_g1_i1.p1  ORF type:complete len:107 (-),score=19.67 TRINITY_DN6907_c0_g1_i1:91-363(-)